MSESPLPVESGTEALPQAPSAAGEAPLQFTLRTLFLAQILCAALLGLLIVAKGLAIFVVLLLLIGTVAFSCISVRPEHLALKRWIVRLLGGVVLPGLCIVYDPVVFCTGSPGLGLTSSTEVQAAVYLNLGFQMCWLLAWLLVGGRLRWLGGLFAGGLYVGGTIALCIGVALLPLSLLGLIAYLIGLLGLTPFLTAYVYLTSATQSLRQAGGILKAVPLAASLTLGVVLALLLPLVLYLLAGDLFCRAIQVAPWPKGFLRS